MTDYGHFTAVDEDDSFEGEFDPYENPVIVEASGHNGDGRVTVEVKPDWCEELVEGHAIGGVVAERGLGDTDAPAVKIGERVVVTTDGFDRATRTYNPLTREGEPSAIGRNARVLTTRKWGEELMGRREAEHEADLDDRRERALDRQGHF